MNNERQAKVNLECAVDLAQKGIPLDFDKICPVIDKKEGLSQDEKTNFLMNLYEKSKPELRKRCMELEKQYRENPENEKQYKHRYGLTDMTPVIGRYLNEGKNKHKIEENMTFYRLANEDKKSMLKSQVFRGYHATMDFVSVYATTCYIMSLFDLFE